MTLLQQFRKISNNSHYSLKFLALENIYFFCFQGILEVQMDQYIKSNPLAFNKQTQLNLV